MLNKVKAKVKEASNLTYDWIYALVGFVIMFLMLVGIGILLVINKLKNNITNLRVKWRVRIWLNNLTL